MASWIVVTTRIRTDRQALETTHRENPCLSEHRSSVDCEVGKATALWTTISQGE